MNCRRFTEVASGPRDDIREASVSLPSLATATMPLVVFATIPTLVPFAGTRHAIIGFERNGAWPRGDDREERDDAPNLRP